MLNKQVAAALVILAAAVIAAGCTSEQQCLDMGFVKAEEEPEIFPTTPIIILENKPNTDLARWMYSKDGDTNFVEQDDSEESIFYDCDTCFLRKDFIGDKLLVFKYQKKGDTNWYDATTIFAKKGDYRIKIWHRRGEQLIWQVFPATTECEGGRDACDCTVLPEDLVDTGTVPTELHSIPFNELNHSGGGYDGKVEKVKIQIEYD